MKLYVGNLGNDGKITPRDLRPLFERYGQVSECRCIKNYAFVHMDDGERATEAVSGLNGTKIKGRTIKVEESVSKGPNQGSKGQQRGRSGSKDRKRNRSQSRDQG